MELIVNIYLNLEIFYDEIKSENSNVYRKFRGAKICRNMFTANYIL